MYPKLIAHALCIVSFLLANNVYPCTADTVIFTGDQIVPMHAACVDMPLVALSVQWKFVSRTIRHSERSRHKIPLVKIIFANEESITVAHTQRFLLFDTHEWATAAQLAAGSRLVRIGDTPCAVQETLAAGSGKVWHIDVGEPHTFFISRCCVVTHNADCTLVMQDLAHAGIVASLTGGCLAGTFAAWLLEGGLAVSGGLATLTAPLSLPGACLVASGAALGFAGYQAYQWATGALSLHRTKEVLRSAEHVSLEMLVEAAKQTDWEPHNDRWVYEVAEYHKPISLWDIKRYACEHKVGAKSPCPPQIEGQLILDYLSFPVGDTFQRAAYVMGIVISFKRTGQIGTIITYHGHYCLGKLSDGITEALKRKGAMNGKGKLIK